MQIHRAIWSTTAHSVRGHGRQRRSDPPASVLSAVVAQVNDASVVSATLGHPPVGVHETDDPSVPNTSEFNNSLWLYVTVKANGMTPAETTEPIWLGNLITGALRDKLYANSEPDLRSSTVAVNLPDGTTILSAGGGVGSVTQGQSSRAPRTVTSTRTLEVRPRQLASPSTRSGSSMPIRPRRPS